VFDGQLEHEPGSPVVPAGHVHALLLALPEGEVERDGQLEQVAEPTDALYLPTVQLVHGPPSGPLEPALHTHSVLPSWLCELPRQGVQAALPSESLKVFDGQLEHEPGSPVVPAGHLHALLLVLPEGEVERDGQLDTRRVVE
jgi:hypothetical protein